MTGTNRFPISIRFCVPRSLRRQSQQSDAILGAGQSVAAIPGKGQPRNGLGVAAIAMEFRSCLRVPQADFADGVARQDATTIRREGCGIDMAAVAGIASQLDATGHVPKPHQLVPSRRQRESAVWRKTSAIHVSMGVEVDGLSGRHVPEAGRGLEAAAESPLSILQMVTPAGPLGLFRDRAGVDAFRFVRGETPPDRG